MKNVYFRAYFWKILAIAKKVALFAVTSIGNIFFNKEKPLELGGVKKILVIHAEHSSIGDAVLFSSIFLPLRKKFPKARIELLIRTPADRILKNNPFIDEIIGYDAEKNANILTQEFAPFNIAGELKKRKYDLVINSEHALRFIFLSFLTRAPSRIGFDFEGRGFLLTKKVAYPAYQKRTKLELEYYLDLVRSLGIETKAGKGMLRVFTAKKDEKFADSFLRENGIAKNDFIVGIHAGGGIWKKRWPLYKFAKLIGELAKSKGAKIIAFGGEEDATLYNEMKKMTDARFALAAGKSSVLETAALVGRCKLIIANDSAISHIASGTDAKVITLFGVDSPARWGPFRNTAIMKHKRRRECGIICNYDYLYAIDGCFDQNSPFCMNQIEVSDVMKEALKKS
ncbi:glycosyltransferase family 9 protein [Candidatus Micrarchaeota archaeon]|nr:glycosyltransferase family 9 protein [Candidatus Micrarchaeota archaeon]